MCEHGIPPSLKKIMSPEITEKIVNKAKIKGFYKNWANASANVYEDDQADHPLTVDEFDFY